MSISKLMFAGRDEKYIPIRLTPQQEERVKARLEIAADTGGDRLDLSGTSSPRTALTDDELHTAIGDGIEAAMENEQIKALSGSNKRSILSRNRLNIENLRFLTK